MKIIRLVLSDLHLGTGVRPGELNPFEDFLHDERFAELLAHYDREAGSHTEIELILNGDIFDLLKVKVDGVWPMEITAEIATEKLRQCLEGHPAFVHALRAFLSKPGRRITYLPGNHDLEMWMEGPQELLRRYVAPGPLADRIRFITESDTYYLPEGIQIRHGHQLEPIHRVDYSAITRKRRDGTEVLALPWGSLWILEVMNPAKEQRNYIDRVQPLGRFLLGAFLFDTRFAFGFIMRSFVHFLRRRVFALEAWAQRIRKLPQLVQELRNIFGGYDEAATYALNKMRGAHTLIVGHSHGPRYKQLPSGKILVNTGTWMPMINMDLQYLGQGAGLTYALIEYSDEGRPTTRLMRWRGKRRELEAIAYAV